jgi:predicted nucleic acid-binding protein
MPPLRALLDANVLYPAELRSFLLYLAVAELYQPKWSEEIHEEWISSLLANRLDLTRNQLERTRELMQKAAPDALVTGYAALMPRLALPDPGDRHILAAAIKGRAAVIVTKNLKDFPPGALAPFGIQAQSPDAFCLRLLQQSGIEVQQAAEQHRLSLKNPAKTRAEYLDTLASQGLLQTVETLRNSRC